MKIGKSTKAEAYRASNDLKIGEYYGLDGVKFLERVVRLAKSHHTIQERFCSEEMADFISNRLRTREKNIEKEITELCKSIGLRPKFDGDPRGYTVKLLPLDKTARPIGNTWGGDEVGYGVGEK